MKKIPSRNQNLLLALGGLAAFCVVYFLVPKLLAVSYREGAITQSGAVAVATTTEIIPPKPVIQHIKTPEAVKGIYMTACAASSLSFITHIKDLLQATELNSVVIDIKDYSGTISFPTTEPILQDGVSGPGCKASGMQELVKEFHEMGVYVIGRITVFQDPHYSKLHPDLAVKLADGSIWKDKKGLSFIDVGSKPYWDYIVALSKASYEIGFDELNFDYVRYPSDGNISAAVFTQSIAKGLTRSGALKEFFAYLDEQLKDVGVVTSADLFGMTTTAHDDMGIGQVIENAMPHFDYIDPMVYPSHFPPTYNGWADPNKVPYDIIKFTMQEAILRDDAFKMKVASSTGTSSPPASFLPRLRPTQIRPWLQDEDYPVPYTPDMVRAQIKGAYDAGLNSWLLWDASNQYTKSALMPDASSSLPTN